MKKVTCLICIAALTTTGCASITGTRNQPVSVTTTYKSRPVSGADCKLTNDRGEWFTTTPGSVMIQKSYGDISIQCKKEEAYSGSKTYASEHEGAVWGNVLTGGLIGYAVDASSGAGFSYPPQMNVDMIKAEETKDVPVANADSAKSDAK